MGNPHAVHIVDDAEAVDLAILGPQLEHHPIFPDRANIEFISQLSEDSIRMRVWERGSGITVACGTGACAATVAAVRAGLTGRKVNVHLDGGILNIEWRDDGGVTMAGPSSYVFDGVINLAGVGP
jgi:diaminopimelate epimerase